MIKSEMTTIQVSVGVKDVLKDLCDKNESYNSKLAELLDENKKYSRLKVPPNGRVRIADAKNQEIEYRVL